MTTMFENRENNLGMVQALLAAGVEDNILEIGRFDADSTGEPVRAGVMLVTKGGKYLRFRNIQAPWNLEDYSGVLDAWEQAFVVLGAIQKYTLNMKKNGNYKSPITGFSKANIVIRATNRELVLDTRKFDTSLTSLALFPKNSELEKVRKERDVKFLCQKHSRNMLRAFGINSYVQRVLAAKNQTAKALSQVTVEEAECTVVE